MVASARRSWATCQEVLREDHAHSEQQQHQQRVHQAALEEKGTRFGDSGGTNLLGGTHTVLDVNSFVANAICSGNTYSYRVDIVIALGWLRSTVAARGGSSARLSPCECLNCDRGHGNGASVTWGRPSRGTSPGSAPAGGRASRASRGSPARACPGRAVGALAAVDDDRHVRVVLVVVDHLVVELVGELTRDHAIDHRLLIVGRDRRALVALEARDLRDEAALVLDVGVPRLEGLLELVELVAAALEPHRLRRVGADAVLVPREVPRDGDGDLAGVAGERDDARLRVAEALRDAADGAAVRAAVEEVGGLEQRDLVAREAAEDRLGRRERLAVARRRPSRSPRPRRRRLRSPGTIGVVGVPSFSQPCSTAISWQSGQTSTSSAPSSGA